MAGTPSRGQASPFRAPLQPTPINTFLLSQCTSAPISPVRESPGKHATVSPGPASPHEWQGNPTLLLFFFFLALPLKS